MSDDKREELREYLGNNRPKNRVNLGNNSNNKENSNKSLENDLNLDNSQILNNKINSIKRDYDKEPILIPNKALGINFLFLIYSLAFMFLLAFIFGVEINFKNWSAQGALGGALFLIKEFFTARYQNIKFANSKIEIIENEIIVQAIENKSIYNLFFNYSNAYSFENKIPISKELIIFSLLLLGISILYFKGFGIFAMLIIAPILGYFIPRIYIFGKNKFKMSKSLNICYEKDNKKEFINILIKLDWYFEIKEYFKNIKNININKNKVVFSVFDNI